MCGGQRSGDDDVGEVTEPARQEPGGAERGTKDGWGFRAAAAKETHVHAKNAHNLRVDIAHQYGCTTYM